MQKHQTQAKSKFSSPLEWGEAACNSIMKTYQPEQLPPANRWHYHQGVFLYGMLKLWEQNQDYNLFQYVKGYADHLIDAQGNFLFNRAELDSIQAGDILFSLHKQTGDDRYRSAADKLLSLFETFNRTSEGGYWHKDRYPYQMWLDGLYMGGSFAMLYAKYYGKTELYDMVLEQEKLMRKHTKDDQTGLYHHAWDESKKTPWSDSVTGKAAEFWGRAIGWYIFALTDFLDLLPDNHTGRSEIQQTLKDVISAVIEVQDVETGLWYQVVDKGGHKDNWLETSCSSLFVYAIAKSINKGYIDSTYREAAVKGFDGLISKMYFNEKGQFIMPDICVGTGVGDYPHYIGREKCENDLHGVGSFVLSCVEMNKLTSS
ncbi:glycoside hydrolase family 88/105 protein [Chengkuizengella axinellae]|uniref:Glycoside hydrolase family 88 protein n=1 Tax=Chengkuizengella axinellae TaxID=3064388 RepID=A0ABT9ITE2_9BACL|nr:glycoside hydrolase family 88 protein [Chengkuizengella sp. 2205SS18-9]MDP5272603.1 glycoside hydrolase family 88 protein [Chengkuizengella sp. 2205SS18-9]